MNDAKVEKSQETLANQAKKKDVIKMHSITPFVVGETDSLMIIQVEFLINRESFQLIQIFVPKLTFPIYTVKKHTFLRAIPIILQQST